MGSEALNNLAGKASMPAMSQGVANGVGATAIGQGISDSVKGWADSIMSYQLMNAMVGLKQNELDANKEIQLGMLSLNGSMLEKQETVALAQLRTQERLGELTKERDVEVAKARSSAAVQIAKVNALNSQFYGQPNQLPSWGVA